MTVVDATSYLSKHVENVRLMIAATATLRAATANGTIAEALSRVYLGYRPYTDEELRPDDFPFVVVGVGDDGFTKRAAGVGSTLFGSGRILVDFYSDARLENQNDSYIAAGNLVGGALGDLVSFVGNDGNVDVQTIQSVMVLEYSGDREGAPYWFSRYAFTWGVS